MVLFAPKTHFSTPSLSLICNQLVLELEESVWTMDITDRLNHNGFAWDEISQKVTDDDDVWEANIYLKKLKDTS